MKNILNNDKFKMSFSGERFKNKNFEDYVNSISVPSITLGTINQGTRMRNLERPGDSLVFSDFALDFFIDENMDNYSLIYNWINDIRNFNKDNFNNELVTDISIVLLTNKNNTNKGFKIGDAFPYNLSGFPMNITENPTRGVIVSLDFKFNYFEFLDNI